MSTNVPRKPPYPPARPSRRQGRSPNMKIMARIVLTGRLTVISCMPVYYEMEKIGWSIQEFHFHTEQRKKYKQVVFFNICP
jgi:hypothetical protein